MTADLRHSRWVLALASVASLMVALDTLVVSTALSTIRLDLGASVAELEWTVNAYNLTFAVLLMTGAALGDRFGRRRVFALGIAVFVAAFGGVRACSEHRHPDRRARGPGRGRRPSSCRSGWRWSAPRSRPSPREGARHLLRRDGTGGRQRARRRRGDHRGARVGVDLLDQRPARHRRHPVRGAADPRELRPGYRDRSRRAWRS